jgi:hypothetical protein
MNATPTSLADAAHEVRVVNRRTGAVIAPYGQTRAYLAPDVDLRPARGHTWVRLVPSHRAEQPYDLASYPAEWISGDLAPADWEAQARVGLAVSLYGGYLAAQEKAEKAQEKLHQAVGHLTAEEQREYARITMAEDARRNARAEAREAARLGPADIESIAREMFPAEYAAITDDRPMDPALVALVKAEQARRLAQAGRGEE